MLGEDGQKLKPLVLGLGNYFFSFLKIPVFGFKYYFTYVDSS